MHYLISVVTTRPHQQSYSNVLQNKANNNSFQNKAKLINSKQQENTHKRPNSTSKMWRRGPQY